MNIGNWTDDSCFYVTVVDGPRVGYLAGPFATHDEALTRVDDARKLAAKRDPWSCFYGFGTAKRANGHLASLFGDVVDFDSAMAKVNS